MIRAEEKLHVAAVHALMGPLDKHSGGRIRERGLLPKPWFCAHVPNGGGRSKAEAGILKAMGVLAGMPDLLVFGPRDHFADGTPLPGPRLIAIEFKAPPKRLRSGGLSKASPRLSPAQRARQADLGACGVPYLVIDDIADMIQSLKALGVPLRGRVL
jgi:hypothetical protein